MHTAPVSALSEDELPGGPVRYALIRYNKFRLKAEASEE